MTSKETKRTFTDIKKKYEKNRGKESDASKSARTSLTYSNDFHQDSKESECPEKANGVVKPSHYTKHHYEPVTVAVKNKMSFALGNVLKYITRAGSKQYDGLTLEESRLTDLRKAQRYIEIEINYLEGKEVL